VADIGVHRLSAEQHAEDADRQRMQSEQSLTGAMDALDEYFQKVSESRLLNKAGLQPLRRELLTSALRYYEGFLTQHATTRACAVKRLGR